MERLIKEIPNNTFHRLLKSELEDNVKEKFYFCINDKKVSIDKINTFNTGIVFYFDGNKIICLDNIDEEEITELFSNVKEYLIDIFDNFNYEIYSNNKKLEVGLLDIIQEFSSAKTSTNIINRIYKNTEFTPNSLVLDYGGGKYDSSIEYLAKKDVTVLVYDPYNQTSEHNKRVLNIVEENNGADYVVCSNVLNVIKECSIIENILEDLDKYCKKGGIIRICACVLDGSNKAKPNKKNDTFQKNKKTKYYNDLINNFFGDKGYTVETVKDHSEIFNIKK
jgi:hypothetical protein